AGAGDPAAAAPKITAVHGMWEIHDQLLDSKNYQNRTNGVEKLKCILSEVDIKSVTPGSVEEFINFLPRLLDDSNFKVLHGTLQVLNLLIQKLETGVDRFLKHIVFVALKALGDTRAVTRNEYHNVFQQLMKTTPPQHVLDLIIGNLKHKNSRVREDVLNIVMAALLTHPRKNFNIPKLCFEVAPYLVDNKKKVRHAALELFAVFDHYLDTGKKQPLMKALDMVELNEDAEGLMAAVHARRARRILPKLTSEGIVEYGLVVPKPGQWSTGQHASGADLDWVINGGRTNSARSYRTEHDSDLLSGYGSLGSLTDDPMFQRRIVSAGKGKNKLPWETSTDNELQQSTTPNGKSLEQVSPVVLFSLFYIFSYVNLANCCFWQNNKLLTTIHTMLIVEQFTSINWLDFLMQYLIVAPKGRVLSRNPSVERTFSLPSNASTPGSFLLPSYPLATCTGGMLTPTLSRHHADSSLSMSNTWPNKRETSPQQQGTSPRREKEDTAKGNLFCWFANFVCHLQMLNSLRTLRNSAAKKRAKVSLGSPDPDSPDSALQVDPRLDSPLQTSPVLTSSASESGLSSLSSAANFNNIKARSGISFFFINNANGFPSCFKGMCGTTVSSNRPGATLLLEQGDLAAKPPTDPLAGIYSRQLDGDDSSHPEEPKVSLTLFRLVPRHFKTQEKSVRSFGALSLFKARPECPKKSNCNSLIFFREKKIEGLMFLRSLAYNHADTLQGKLHEVCLCLTQEVKNLRSGVSRVAVCTLGDLYTHLQRLMDQELEGTVKALLQKAGESNTFIRQDVDAALDCMVQHCTPTRCIGALLTGGIRYFGRRMLLFLSSHPDFDKNLEKYIPTKDLQTVRDTVLTLRTKGLGEMPQDSQSARGRRSLPGSGTVRASSLNGEQLNQTNRSEHIGLLYKNEYIKQISGLLGSKDFRERIKGIDQLVADCEHNPNMVVNSIFPVGVFDAFKARLQESNSKVNLYALESLQKITHLLKDSLSQVVNILVPAIVDNHLNSKNNAIYSAAIGALNALIFNLDNILLLQPFCTKAQFLSGKAKMDLIEKVAGLVKELYPRKPQMVEQKVLPLLWHLLGTSTHSGSIHGRSGSVRTATAKLCQALLTQMGSSLNEFAASQPTNVQKGLNELLKTIK
uniref:TOG array regulator of axonemal microtubules 1 n=1 Tax=Xiphophorus couchianus TaxID=32473 RepID=A0A3B5LR96_9TELE